MKIAIIGAGFAGLTTAKHLKEFGHDVIIFEKVGDIGGVWSASRTYPGVCTQSGKGTYHLSDHPMPKNYPEWPSGPQVQAYLESYIEKFGLQKFIRLNTEVKSATQSTKGHWTLETEKGTEIFDFVVVCNGTFSKPAIPNYTGRDAFVTNGGRICHSSQFINLEDARGKNVVVIGYGKSSCDVAAALVGTANTVTVVAREIIWKVPKKFANILNYKYLILTRMGEALAPYLHLKGTAAFLHGLGKPIRDSLVGIVQSITTKQLGLKKLNLVPRGNFERIARSTLSLVTEGFFDMIRAGKIIVKRDCEITTLSKASASLSSGETIAADIIICGTGWHQEVPFLDEATQAKIIDSRGNFRLYKCILPPNVNGLAFNGYNSSTLSPLLAEIASLWIAAYLANEIKLPSIDQQIAKTDERLAWMEERTEGKHARGTSLLPFSMNHIDELLEDIQLPISLVQRFLEWHMPIKPSAYIKVTKKLKKRLIPDIASKNQRELMTARHM